MTTTPTPPLEDDVKPIRDALATLPSGWTLDVAGPGDAVGFALVGCVDEADEFYAVVEVDTDNYGQDDASLPIAQFYAAANPERIARLLAHIEAQAVRLDAAERDAGRYQLLRRGQHWSVIDGIGDILRAEVLDAAIDTQRAAIASEAGK